MKNEMQKHLQNFVQMLVEKNGSYAEMNCRNRAEFGTARLCRKKMAAMQNTVRMSVQMLVQ